MPILQCWWFNDVLLYREFQYSDVIGYKQLQSAAGQRYSTAEVFQICFLTCVIQIYVTFKI